jgi:3-methylcrotonyl-CoA carboxylase alpha subunit
VTRFAIPGSETIRVDSGIRAGSEVSPHYDSLLAKIIARGPDRATAVSRLSAALGDLALIGVGSNQRFLRNIVDHPDFRGGAVTTRFLAQAFPDGWTDSEPRRDDEAAIAAVAWAEARARHMRGGTLGPWATLGGFRLLDPAGRPARLLLDVDDVAVTLGGGKGHYTVTLVDRSFAVDAEFEADEIVITVDGLRRRYRAVVTPEGVALARAGRTTTWRVSPRIDAAGRAGQDEADAGNRILAAMPGLIAVLDAAPGQRVSKGEILVVLEAMKLMHSLAAPVSGIVSAVFCQARQTVAAGAVLVVIEEA